MSGPDASKGLPSATAIPPAPGEPTLLSSFRAPEPPFGVNATRTVSSASSAVYLSATATFFFLPRQNNLCLRPPFAHTYTCVPSPLDRAPNTRGKVASVAEQATRG